MSYDACAFVPQALDEVKILLDELFNLDFPLAFVKRTYAGTDIPQIVSDYGVRDPFAQESAVRLLLNELFGEDTFDRGGFPDREVISEALELL